MEQYEAPYWVSLSEGENISLLTSVPTGETYDGKQLAQYEEFPEFIKDFFYEFIPKKKKEEDEDEESFFFDDLPVNIKDSINTFLKVSNDSENKEFKMKIVLLGASGQLGREWQVFLSGQENEDINLLSYTSSQLDITDTEKIVHELRGQQPDIVINCAAYTDVDGAEEHRAAARKVNTGAVEELAAPGLGESPIPAPTFPVSEGCSRNHFRIFGSS